MEQNMKNINISNDIIPINEFKTGLAKWFKNVQSSGHPLIITQNGRPAGVLLSPEEYDDLSYNKSFLKSINKGITDIENNNFYDTDELKSELNIARSKRISE